MAISLPQFQIAPPDSLVPPAQRGRRFHVMAKPTGCKCNLDCTYCYYLSKEQLHGVASKRMSDDTLELFIRQYIDGQDYPSIVFSWQGGEPTLLGLEFFEKVVALQRQHCPPGKTIENDLQTNGTLLDDDWCRFLKEHRFLVGLSIDGPRELHDAYRLTKKGQPTFDKVYAAAMLLKKHKVPFNTLTVVNRVNARRPLDVYRFLTRELGSTYVQFIPCVEPKDFASTAPQHWNMDNLPVVGTDAARPGAPDSIVTDWSVDPEDWGYFLSRTFDDWHGRDVGRVLVNMFETLVSQQMGLGSQVCIFGEICGKGLAIEGDGSVYRCDHYVYPEHRAGNIHQRSLADMVFTDAQMQFAFAKSKTLPVYCCQCPHLQMCWGECPKNRFVRTPSGEPGLNYLCPGLKTFFAHAMPHVREIVQQVESRRPPSFGPGSFNLS